MRQEEKERVRFGKGREEKKPGRCVSRGNEEMWKRINRERRGVRETKDGRCR